MKRVSGWMHRCSAVLTAGSLGLSLLFGPIAHGACAMRGAAGPDAAAMSDGGFRGHEGHRAHGGESESVQHPTQDRDAPPHSTVPCLSFGACLGFAAAVVPIVTGNVETSAQTRSPQNVAMPPSFQASPDLPPPKA